jgi:cell division transport system permease protein
VIRWRGRFAPRRRDKAAAVGISLQPGRSSRRRAPREAEVFEAMKLGELGYIVDESVLMLKRRGGATVLSVVIMGLSLLILIVFVLVTLNISDIIGRAGEELRVYVYLEDDIAAAASRDIQYRLLGMRGVEEVVFISRGEAMEHFREALGGDSDVLESLEENPLPDAYRMKLGSELYRSGILREMAEKIEQWEGIEDVRYGRRWFERGEELVRGFYMVDLGIGFIVFFSVVFVIANTVRLTILARRRTIDVLKYVGATNAYIQVPFVIEGALQGIFAALLAVGLLAAVFTLAKRYLPGLVFLGSGWVAGFVVFCALLGALGSFLAMRRFLKM